MKIIERAISFCRRVYVYALTRLHRYRFDFIMLINNGEFVDSKGDSILSGENIATFFTG